MHDNQLKRLISKLTGVDLIKTAMPVLSGQNVLDKRSLVWHRFDVTKEPPIHLPQLMRMEMPKLINKFISSYKKHVPDANAAAFTSMVFVWYGEDPSVTEDELKKISESNLPQDQKDKLLEVANFIQKWGVPLAKTKEEFEKSRKATDRDGQYNGGQVHLENFGYAWGAEKKSYTDDGSRETTHIPRKKMNDPAWKQKNIEEKGKVLVGVVTAPTATPNGWGIFLNDGSEFLPPVPEKFLQKMRDLRASSNQPLNPDDPAMLEIIKQCGGIDKFFGFRSVKNPDSPATRRTFTPCQKRFLLDNPELAIRLGSRGYIQSTNGDIPCINKHVAEIEKIYIHALKEKETKA